MAILETWTISPPSWHHRADPNVALTLMREVLTSQDSTFLTAGHHPAEGIASRMGHCKFREQAGQLSGPV